MALDLGELSARVTVDDSRVPRGLAAVHRRVSQFGADLRRQAEQIGTGAGDKVGGGFSSAAKKGLSGLGSIVGGGARMIGTLGLAGVTAFGAVTAAAGGMGLAAAASNEQARISFTTMLGSAEKADSFLRDMQKFAATTPFEFPELQEASSALISAGINADKVIPIMTTLGDVTSGMGTGAEGVDRATTALQQMSAAGRITGEDLNQLRDAGIPVYDLLASATGKSKAEVIKLAQAGKLGKKELDQMMKALESGKGLERFNGLMAKQSTSLTGMVSTMKDTIGQGLGNAIAPLIPMIKDGLGGATEFAMRVMDKVPGVLMGIINGAKSFSKSAVWADIRSVGERVFAVIVDAGKQIPGMLAGAGDALERFGHSQTWAAIKEAAGFIGDAFTSAIIPAVGWLLTKGVPAIAAVVETMFRWRGVLVPIGVGLGVVVAGMAAASGLQSIMAAGGFLKWLRATLSATRLWTGVQWALNVAMSANPIGLVVIAIAALAAGVIYAYKHSEKFRKICQAVFGWLKEEVPKAFFRVRDDIVATWEDIKGTFTRAGKRVVADVKATWDDITSKFRAAKDWVTGTWKKGWSAVSGAISGAVGSGKKKAGELWDNVQDRFTSARRWVTGTWKKGWSATKDAIGDAVESGRDRADRSLTSMRGRFTAAKDWATRTWRKAWSAIKDVLADPVQAGRDAISRLFGTDDNSGLRGRFTGFVRAAKRIFNGIKAAIKSPISSVIDIINTGLLGAFNWVIDKLKLPKSLRVNDIKIKGYREGGPTGAGMSDHEVAGVTHANEHVWTANEVRAAGGHGRIERLRQLARAGALRGLPGFFLGGAAPAPGGSNRHSGYSWARWAGDFPQGTATPPVHAWKEGIVAAVRYLTTSYGKHVRINHPGNENTLYAHLSRIIVAAGQRVRRGQTIGYVGSTGNSTGNHLHFELAGGGAKVRMDSGGTARVAAPMGEPEAFPWIGKFGSVAAAFRDRISNGMRGLRDLGGSGWGGMVARVPGQLVSATVDRVKGMVPAVLRKVAAAVGNAVTGVFTPGAGGMGRWTPYVQRALRMNGLPLSLTDNWLAQIKSESGGNPKAVQQVRDVNWPNNKAVGLVQVIPDTFARYRSPDLPNDRTNPLASLYAGMNYAKHRYNNLEAVIGHGHGYANGIGYATAGVRGVAESGAELVLKPQVRRFRGGEQVLNPQDTRKQLGGLGASYDDRPYIGELSLVSSGNIHDDLAEVGFKIRTIARGGAHAGR
jgi:tape measure domain-containing protein